MNDTPATMKPTASAEERRVRSDFESPCGMDDAGGSGLEEMLFEVLPPPPLEEEPPLEPPDELPPELPPLDEPPPPPLVWCTVEAGL